MEEQETSNIQPESMSLTRNSKGYGWKIKIFIDDKDDEKAFNRLVGIEEVFNEKYGKEEGGEEKN